jgi:hypothetical protein
VQSLTRHFIPAADEVHFLQVAKTPEGQFFRSFSEKGHYGGRARPTSTRQGIYAVAPSGEFLASINTRDPRAMERMMKQALEAWKRLPKEKRLLVDAPAPRPRGSWRHEDRFPEDGLVLSVTTRDLPRKRKPEGRRDWRSVAWNIDRAWFRAEEARGFLPPKPKKGATHEVPSALVRRLSRCHFIDNVRGQTIPYADSAVQSASLTATVESVSKKEIEVRFSGKSVTRHVGRWHVGGPGDGGVSEEQSRGLDLVLLGRGTWDVDAERWSAFELVAAGERHGATRYNARHDDQGPAPWGAVLRLDDGDPPSRVAPAHLGAYGWR